MAARANFLCEKCMEDYELPVTAKTCPICSAEIVRLYDQINIATGLAKSNAVEKLAQPYAEARDAKDHNKKVAEAQTRELVDRIDHALPELTKQEVFQGPRGISAQQAIGMVSGDGRMMSRQNAALLFGRKVSHVKIKE